MEIDYTNSRVDYIAHSTVALGGASGFAYQHYSWVAYWGVMAGLGVYVSVVAGLIFMAAIFTAMFLIYVVRAVPYSRVLRQAIERGPLVHGIKRIHLRLDEDGLHETVEDQVESFAPWSAMQRFVVGGDYLLIELAGDLWANIPRNSVVQGQAAVDEIVAILRAHKIPEEQRSKL